MMMMMGSYELVQEALENLLRVAVFDWLISVFS
jgi:hypothetical protein